MADPAVTITAFHALSAQWFVASKEPPDSNEPRTKGNTSWQIPWEGSELEQDADEPNERQNCPGVQIGT
eukprot:scaffold22105_cov108-Skeletonema_dohrnii-CCMP3373.AAC.2